jgi:hypothetical protein
MFTHSSETCSYSQVGDIANLDDLVSFLRRATNESRSPKEPGRVVYERVESPTARQSKLIEPDIKSNPSEATVHNGAK